MTIHCPNEDDAPVSRKQSWVAIGVFGLLIIAAIVGSIQIMQMSSYLHAREPMFKAIIANEEEIIANQRVILERMK